MSGKLSNESTKRTQGMNPNLSPEMYEKLQAVSATLGMAPTLVATMAISEYVALKFIAFGQHEDRIEKTLEALLPHMAPMFQSLADQQETKE